MKKLCVLFIFICAIANAAFAASSVDISADVSSLQSEMIKNKYVGLNVQIHNGGKNPVKIVSVSIPEIVNNANAVLVQDGLSELRKNNKYVYMCFFTLGISGLVGMAKGTTTLNNQKAALAEAATFGTQYSLETFKNEIIMPNSSKTFKVLVPANQKATVDCVVQDVQTNQYFESKVVK